MNIMKDTRNIVTPGDSAVSEPKECWIPNRMFLAMYIIGIISMVLVSLSGLLDRQASTGLFTLTVVYGLLGSLMFFKSISIVRCPSRVLLGAVAFVGVTAFIDKYYI